MVVEEKGGNPLIFIAEDIPKNLQVLCNILRKESYRISAAGNGRQALNMIPEVRPDLILLDIMMPDINGFDVCEELQKNPKTKEIPIIFLTAKAETADIVRGLKAGAVDYITKPFNGAELLARVRTHLELKFAREELKELIATRDKFFSIIAHDLRNPLQFLVLSSDLLYNEYDSLTEDSRKEYVRKFYTGTNRISALLENLLDWSRSQRGLIECKPEKIDVHVMAVENIDLLKAHAKSKDIRAVSRVGPGIFAFADKNMIRTVLRNLLSNAVKFTDTGGEIVIDAYREGDRVAITVSDNGVGMTPEAIDGLYRIDGSKSSIGTARERGSGLGLILCKEFTEKNNGTIDAVSEPGKGSTFTVTLPAK